MGNQILEIRAELQNKLPPMRYEHSISVSFLSTALAMRYGYDLKKAELAGLLHDCAKQYDDETIIKKCDKHNIQLSEEQRKAPAVLHAVYGSWMAENHFGIKDTEILSAIRWHTTGKPDMILPEKLLYVSDYIEPRRYKAENLSEIRSIAFLNLEQCIYKILKSTLKYLADKNSNIDSNTCEAFQYYKLFCLKENRADDYWMEGE